MKMFSDIYRGRKVLITGHTGFKGSWLALWLTELGAKVYGLSLPPDTEPNHWELLGLSINECLSDLRNYQATIDFLNTAKPELVFHLAAQPLVRRSYQSPLETWSTNVMGTANLLEACRKTTSVKAVVVVTTDKVYKNREWEWGYRENDELGGHDPYSASKAAVELVVDSYRQAFCKLNSSILIASTRAGNVIGGGDWAEDRLIPDLARSVQGGTQLSIRSPDATRPWQHVLECLSGYLLLGQKFMEGQRQYASAWNIGPGPESNKTVNAMLIHLRGYWPELKWQISEKIQPHEAGVLYLDSSKMRKLLKWEPVWTFDEGIAATAAWYQSFISKQRTISRLQLESYTKTAVGKAVWAEK